VTGGAIALSPIPVSRVVEIDAKVGPGAHAALLVDHAGWHTSPRLVVPWNIIILPLPRKCPAHGMWTLAAVVVISDAAFGQFELRGVGQSDRPFR
jgi:hypothetical protein